MPLPSPARRVVCALIACSVVRGRRRWGRCRCRPRRAAGCARSSRLLRGHLPGPPCGSSPLPSPARTVVWMCIVSPPVRARRGHRRGDRCRCRPQRGGASSCSSRSPGGGSRQPLGSIPAPLPARTFVVVLIGFTVGSRRSAVRVDPRALPGRYVRRGLHQSLQASAVGIDHHALAGPDAGVGAHRHPPARFRRVSRWGRSPGPCRRGRASWYSSDPPVAASAVGVDSPAPAGADARRGVHRRLQCGISRWGPCRRRCRRGRASWCSSWFSRVAQPLGSIPPPLPARIEVVAPIVALRSGSRQPLGSIIPPWPARTWVGVCIVMLRFGLRSAVGIDQPAFGGADAGRSVHRIVSRQPLGLIAPPSPARAWVVVCIGSSPVSRWG